jgi:hypothetical protein
MLLLRFVGEWDLGGQVIEFVARSFDLALQLGALRGIQFDGGAG